MEHFSPTPALTTSNVPGATIKLSITLLILVTRDRMEAWGGNRTGIIPENLELTPLPEHKTHFTSRDNFQGAYCGEPTTFWRILDSPSSFSRGVWGNFGHSTCSAAVGARSWFLLSRASLKAVSSAAGLTRGNAISHWMGHNSHREFYLFAVSVLPYKSSSGVQELPLCSSRGFC